MERKLQKYIFRAPSEEDTEHYTSSKYSFFRLCSDLIDTIGDIIHGEHPELCMSSKVVASGGARTTEDAMRMVDCRVYRNFLNINSLKSATAFMNAYGKDELQAQIYTIHLAQFISLENKFKSISHTTINARFKLANMAIEEQKNVLSFISRDPWPMEMKAREQIFFKQQYSRRSY